MSDLYAEYESPAKRQCTRLAFETSHEAHRERPISHCLTTVKGIPERSRCEVAAKKV